MTQWSFSVSQSAADIDPDAWHQCDPQDRILTSRDFFCAMEQSGSAQPETGWHPCHGQLRRAGTTVGIAPLYIKTHSFGEYVFDQSWAKAFEQAGGQYYPKLMGCLPFTPVSSERLLCTDPSLDMSDVKRRLASSIVELYQSAEFSSAHLTFCTGAEAELLASENWLIRKGLQYHWHNEGYPDFDAFLAALSSRKRKMIRKEREKAHAIGLRFSVQYGHELSSDAWKQIDFLYRATTDRRWGNAYLKRDFFPMFSALRGAQIVVMMAHRDDKIVAAAINICEGQTLYGRYWCCAEDLPHLHFELCYYQAIDWAIARHLARVEAGAQGEHKVLRGYRPQYTWSAHHIAHPQLRMAIETFLKEESAMTEARKTALEELLPFQKESC